MRSAQSFIMFPVSFNKRNLSTCSIHDKSKAHVWVNIHGNIHLSANESYPTTGSICSSLNQSVAVDSLTHIAKRYPHWYARVSSPIYIQDTRRSVHATTDRGYIDYWIMWITFRFCSKRWLSLHPRLWYSLAPKKDFPAGHACCKKFTTAIKRTPPLREGTRTMTLVIYIKYVDSRLIRPNQVTSMFARGSRLCAGVPLQTQVLISAWACWLC